MPTEERWNACWQAVALRPPQDLYGRVRTAYTEPQRAYHTLQHLHECFTNLDRARHLALCPADIELALWFHDAIYDTQANDSEERSAAWAVNSLKAASAPPGLGERIAALIFATRHASPPSTPDAALLMDVDLAILGATAERYVEYEAQIRQKYAWVSESIFRMARAQLLSRFLERPAIFVTPYFRDRLEQRARANLAASLRQLAGDAAQPP